MALQKEIELENGVTINYHRIDRISFNKNGVIISVHSYLNDAARLAGKKPLKVSTVDLENEQVAISFADAYTLLKTKQYFQGAIDC